MFQFDPMRMAGIAQRLVNTLAINCPPTYRHSGAAFAAAAAMDRILETMGLGVAMLQRRQGMSLDTSAFEEFTRQNAVAGHTVLPSYVEHKSHILGSALHSILKNPRKDEFRECEEVTERALMTVLEWYFEKIGASSKRKAAFWQTFMEGGPYDQLIQEDRHETSEKEKKHDPDSHLP